MNAYIKSEEYEYSLENVVSINFTNGMLTILHCDDVRVQVSQFTKENLEDATINII